jgi:hypothetical protein
LQVTIRVHQLFSLAPEHDKMTEIPSPPSHLVSRRTTYHEILPNLTTSQGWAQ